jgi:hypothetical protein
MTRRELPKRPRPPRKSPDTTPYRLSALPCGHVKVSLASGEVGPAGGTLTRPAPAGKSAGHGPPSPRRGCLKTWRVEVGMLGGRA